jgi:hypothetical protein
LNVPTKVIKIEVKRATLPVCQSGLCPFMAEMPAVAEDTSGQWDGAGNPFAVVDILNFHNPCGSQDPQASN